MWREQAGSLHPSPPKAAKLHPPVEHAPKSDTTIFAQPAIEVHALCNGTPAPRVGPYSPKIQRMLDSRRERHTLAWQQYTASRNAAERELQASVGSLVAGLRERLASSDARLEANMAQLADETVMQLEEAGVNEIWDIVDRAIPERRSWIDELGTALNTAEDGRRQAVEKGLRVMTQQMHDIAHLSPGDIERLGEEEAIKTNLDMLDNKKAYIDLQKRLQLAENEAAISRRQRWDAGLLAWRTLRTQHAITEDETDALAAAAFQTLQREALGYGGYPEAELQALLDSTCGPALACRRTDAVGLLDAAKAFLDDQAGQWHSMLESMGKLMAELSEMHDRHKASTRNINDAVRRALQTTGQEFDNHNEMREADFARAVLEVSQGSSEKVLDEKVAAALRCLDGIEDGYRSFHATMTSILRQHPTNISNASDAYEASLSTTFTAADATDAAIAKFDQINPQETPAATAAPTGKLTTAKSASLAKPAEPARSKASEGNRPKSPDAKGPPPSSTGTADAAADADAGTPPAEAPAIEIPGQRIPASQAGEPLCSELPTQADGIRQLLSAIRLAFLEEMDAFAEATCQDAASWANDQEVAETEALDARLRSHRPRAGRVEEETRQARAVELIAQRRKVDIHMRSQAKAIAAQEAAVKAAAEAAAEAAQKGIERLRAMEKLLFSCQSVKFLEIRKREAEAYKVKLDKELQAGCDQVTELSAASAQKLLDGNAKFGADTLKTFAEGGRFAPENVAEYQQKLASVTLAVEYNRASQAAAAEAARVAAVASANAALEAVISSLPPHRADLALIETLDRALEAARRNARHEFEASNAAAAAIEADAVLLQSLVDNKATAERECLQGLPCCQAILDTTERLRQALVLRAKSLQHLKSTAMTATPLDVQLTPAGAAGSGVTTSGGPATAAPTPRVPNPSVSNTPCVLATPRKDGKKAEPPADVVTTIAERIEGVISQSEAETAKVSQEYYAAAAAAVPKPKITRPERIPEDLAQMQELNRKILQELREQLAAHLAAAVDQLHNQVIRLSRILEKLPAAASDALTQHELALASAARQALSSGFEAQHATLAAQHRANKLALHPNLGHPTRQQELQDLSNQEAQRNASSVTLTKKHAAGAMELVGSQGPAVYMRQLRLTRLLLQLLDGFMMPDDLPGTESPAESAPDAPAVKEVPRKNLKQLKQMALARDQAAGEPAGAPAAAATAAKPAAAPSKLSKVPSSKGGKGAAALAAAVERPMAGMQWKLVAPAVSLVALGWTPEDAAKYKLEEPPAPISEEPRKTSLGAGKPGGAAAAKLKPPPAKAAATAAAQTPPSPATGALPAEEARLKVACVSMSLVVECIL
ncbi:hypothetical protein WJX72_005556 [[Myrmecia] bisecta]|uniref:DUF4455 domain-containing protein n=1 Tax=[Myrmecia] bisecta TaxID=41462 RepID=A0AAW1Q958_9CHLO